ncbi:UNVERIFIED_ORG: hypothetical protein J2791_002991 [Burkholderia contaminans]|nr:hypothetical protein [Burkholderia contaminans]
MKLAESDPKFGRALVLIHERRMTLQDAIRMVYAIVSPGSRIRWEDLANPGRSQCLEMSAAMKELARLTEQHEHGEMERFPLSMSTRMILELHPTLPVFAVLRATVPCSYEDVVNTLGVHDTVNGLRQFSSVLEQASLIG